MSILQEKQSDEKENELNLNFIRQTVRYKENELYFDFMNSLKLDVTKEI